MYGDAGAGPAAAARAARWARRRRLPDRSPHGVTVLLHGRVDAHTLGPAGLNPENLHNALGVSDDEYDQMLDDTFGPSPEERAEAAGQQQGGGEG
ncbi:hypothetical protein [Streptomyces sp. NPDC059262]|uniref:hypothetical protein n=1 Tax=Streptomyces sp. NPDC059262 TaxID=3346797 RepID=UPI003697DD69